MYYWLDDKRCIGTGCNCSPLTNSPNKSLDNIPPAWHSLSLPYKCIVLAIWKVSHFLELYWGPYFSKQSSFSHSNTIIISVSSEAKPYSLSENSYFQTSLRINVWFTFHHYACHGHSDDHHSTTHISSFYKGQALNIMQDSELPRRRKSNNSI